jgi:hypothetical protein
MTVSLVYLYGTGILTYRLLRHEKKKTLKLIHAIGTRASILNFTYSILCIKKFCRSQASKSAAISTIFSSKRFRTLIKTLPYCAKVAIFANFAQSLVLQNFANLPKARVLS